MSKQMPCCAHSRIEYSHEPAGQGKNLAGNPVDLVRDCWKCRDCGTEFVPAPWVQLEVSRATKELRGMLEIRSIEVRNEERRTDAAESKLAALQERVKALREALDAAQTFAEELSDVEANENRYSHAAVATTIAVRISELRTALSQVPAQKEQAR